MQLISFRGGIATEAQSISLPTKSRKLITTDEEGVGREYLQRRGEEHR